MVEPRRTRDRAGVGAQYALFITCRVWKGAQTFPDGGATACPTDSASVFAYT